MSFTTYKAMMFARDKHKDQKRKYTNDPYFIHLAEVAALVETCTLGHEVEPKVMIATAWLHDVIEDQNVTHQELVRDFGDQVADGVLLLSDLETGNRTTRKQLARDRLSKAPEWVQTIKIADLCSNAPSIITHDPKFANTYVKEAKAYLDVFQMADYGVWRILNSILKDNENV